MLDCWFAGLLSCWSVCLIDCSFAECLIDGLLGCWNHPSIKIVGVCVWAWLSLILNWVFIEFAIGVCMCMGMAFNDSALDLY